MNVMCDMRQVIWNVHIRVQINQYTRLLVAIGRCPTVVHALTHSTSMHAASRAVYTHTQTGAYMGAVPFRRHRKSRSVHPFFGVKADKYLILQYTA